MPPVRLGPIFGLNIQLAMLTALAITVGLGPAGWAAGVIHAFACAVLLTRALHTAGTPSFGPADRVTLTRAALGGAITALAAESFVREVPVSVFASLTALALALDAVDGLVARRTRSASDFGARFDMEVDAYLLAVLSVYVAPSAGLWVLAIGGMRYAWVVASWALPWMRKTLPPRYWRKVVAAVEGVVLLVVSADIVGYRAETAALVIALMLLVESFGRDFGWLWRRRGAALPHASVDVAGTA